MWNHVLSFRCVVMFALLLPWFSLGCGGSSDRIPTGSISGEVTWEGNPLEKGVIQFQPDQDAQGNPLSGQMVQADIRAGKYQVDANPGAVVGRNRVVITATRVAGKVMQDGEEVEKHEQFLPAKYNTATTLFEDINSGRNELNFTLEP